MRRLPNPLDADTRHSLNTLVPVSLRCENGRAPFKAKSQAGTIPQRRPTKSPNTTQTAPQRVT